MTQDQKENYRLGFFECLAIMREAFLKVAPVDSPEIQNYLEANDIAHGLLSELTQDEQEIAEEERGRNE